MTLPALSHLEIAVLGIIGKDQKISWDYRIKIHETVGEVIREELGKFGIRIQEPAFYQLMSRLEREKFISGRHVREGTDKQAYRRRIYQVRRRGEVALDQTLHFYDQLRFWDKEGH